jgi:sec-independent protein translocase protein TatB
VFDIGTGEFLALAVLALLVLGPEKLPRYAAEAARFLRQLRNLANDARSEVTRELGPELEGLDLRELNPRSLIRKHLLDDLDGDDGNDEDDRPAPRRQQTPRNSPGAASSIDAPFDPDTT